MEKVARRKEKNLFLIFLAFVFLFDGCRNLSGPSFWAACHICVSARNSSYELVSPFFYFLHSVDMHSEQANMLLHYPFILISPAKGTADWMWPIGCRTFNNIRGTDTGHLADDGRQAPDARELSLTI